LGSNQQNDEKNMADVAMNAINLLRNVRRLITRPFVGEIEDPPYHYQPGDIVVEDFAEFSGLPLDVVADRIANFRRINAADWHALDAKSFSERAATFYETSQNYVFDTLSANLRPQLVVDKLNRFNPRFLMAIREHPGKRLFEFGGGVGVFCEIAARMGKDVYYLDLPGIVFDFAQWRFGKYGLKVTAIEAKADRISVPGKYDIVYTDAVIEHLPSTLQVEAIEAIGHAIDDGGLLVCLIDLSGPTEAEPMHHFVNISHLHGCLRATGLSCDFGENRSCSMWRRP
jgi:2-polyprenyl-3-methyl-5-hydroxy-6-metoxy-1,4-benzoquinol methylase